MSQDLQTSLDQTELNQNRKKPRVKTELSVQTFGHQLIRLEKLLRACGDKDRQKLLLETLLQSY